MIDIKRNLSQELIFTLVTWEHWEHIIFTCRHENTLSTSQRCDFAGVSLQDETKILLLVPNVDTTVGSTRVADTIFVEDSAWKLGLLELGSKSTVLEQLLACISWVPELHWACCHGTKFEIIWFLWPLDIVDRIWTSWKGQKHLLSLHVVNIHGVVITLINSCNISLAWADG